jgi:hypothetical protein
MVQAAALGVIDFTKSDPRNKAWWFRLRLILDQLEDFNLARQHRLYYDYDLAVLGRPDLTEDGYKKFTKDATHRLYDIINVYRAWDPIDPATTQANEVSKADELWKQSWGDRNDPKIKAAIADTVRMLTQMDVAARKPANAPTVLG